MSNSQASSRATSKTSSVSMRLYDIKHQHCQIFKFNHYIITYNQTMADLRWLPLRLNILPLIHKQTQTMMNLFLVTMAQVLEGDILGLQTINTIRDKSDHFYLKRAADPRTKYFYTIRIVLNQIIQGCYQFQKLNQNLIQQSSREIFQNIYANSEWIHKTDNQPHKTEIQHKSKTKTPQKTKLQKPERLKTNINVIPPPTIPIKITHAPANKVLQYSFIQPTGTKRDRVSTRRHAIERSSPKQPPTLSQLERIVRRTFLSSLLKLTILHHCKFVGPLNLDSWTSYQQLSEVPDAGKTFTNLRKTVYARGAEEGNWRVNRSFQNDYNLEESIIPHLKHILRKLQSPEKQREDKDKKRRTENWQQKIVIQERMRRQREAMPRVLVDQLIEPKRTSIRVKNSSNEKKRSKLIVRSAVGSLGNSIQQSPIKYTMPDETSLDPKDFGQQQVGFIKEARRRRTLKNLLF